MSFLVKRQANQGNLLITFTNPLDVTLFPLIFDWVSFLNSHLTDAHTAFQCFILHSDKLNWTSSP